MKHLSIIFLLCTLWCWSPLLGQSSHSKNSKGDFERFKAEKNAFIAEYAQLTPEEAGKAFPLYDEMQTQKFALNREIRSAVRAKTGRDKSPSAEECDWAIDQLLSIPTKEAQMDKEFYNQLKTILPPCKALKFRIAEERFARHMMQKLGQRKNEKKEGK